MNIRVINFFLRIKKYDCFCFCFAFLYAGIFCSLTVDAFVDRDNYLIFAAESSAILEYYLANGFVGFLSNEPLWLSVNIALSYAFESDDVVRLIVFFSSFITSFLVLRSGPRYLFLLLLFLLLPQVLKNSIIHLRQGFAISIFLIGWFAHDRGIKGFFMVMAALIHSSFIFVLLFFCMLKLFKFLRLPAFFSILLFLLGGLLFGYVGIMVANYFGARQGSEYQSYVLEGSGLAFFFWGGIFVLYVSAGRKFINGNLFSLVAVVFYLATYFFSPVSARIFESCLILILLSGLNLSRWRFVFYVCTFMVYFIMQWYPRLGLLGFGWAIESYT